MAGLSHVPVLKQIDALPCSQQRAAACDGNAQADRKQRRFDMGGHVIRAFIGVGQVRHAWIGAGWDKPPEKVGKVRLHFRVRVFLNQERTGCVPDKQGEQAIAFTPVEDITGEFIKPLATGLNCKRCLIHVAGTGPGSAKDLVALLINHLLCFGNRRRFGI